MEIIYKKINEIKPYSKNPRKNNEAVPYVAKSIKEFGFKVPIIIDGGGTIVCGHTRYKAAKSLGLEEVPCILADDLSEEQIKAFRLADNKVAEKAEWDLDLLDIELDDIINLDMTEFGFDLEENEEENKNEKHNKLSDIFIAPPFSVLDTRQGYWQNRKKEWLDLGIKSELGRKEGLLGSGLKKLNEKFTNGSNALNGVSIFDPVLCEVGYKWFNVDNGKIFDCFAGGSVRGIVAAKLGYDYIGIDLRQEQIDANINNAKELGLEPKWFCDDSLNADKYVEDNSVDLLFSCPPYADLEVYSDDPRDISNMNYEDFCNVYKQIIDIACKKLKDDRFAIFTVGDVRDKNGIYRNFVDYTKQCFLDNGLSFYNEIILLNVAGTAQLRANKVFNSGRKIIKVHQNVLVFYKGNPKNIKNNFKNIEIKEEF